MPAPAKASRWIQTFEDFIPHLRIKSKEESSLEDDGMIPLVLWDSQRRFLIELATGLDLGIRTFYNLKSRQQGVTTISVALVDVFWPAMHPGIKGCLVTENEKNRDGNRSLIENYVKGASEFFGDQFYITKSNSKFIEYSNGSRVDLLVAGTKAKKSTSWGEGQGYTFGHLTEVAAYGDEAGLASLEESFAQANPNRLFVYESTAKGFGLWRDKWLSGFEDPLTKRSWFAGWWSLDTNRVERSDPRFRQFGGYAASGEEREKVAAVLQKYKHKITPEQLAWIRWKEATAGNQSDMLDQNQPWTADDAFVQSGFSFFQTRAIGKRLKEILDNPQDFSFLAYRYDLGARFLDMKLIQILDERQDGEIELRVWEEPVDTGKYVIGMDTAYGRNEHKDCQAIEVYRCYADKIVQVAEFVTPNIDVNHAAWVLAHIAGGYRDCVVNIEINGPGGNVMTEWDNLRGQLNAEHAQADPRSQEWQDALGYARWYLWHRPDSMGAGYAYNTMTTGKTGEMMMHGLRSAFVMEDLVVRSKRLLHEMSITVVDESGHIGARESKDPNSKDDRVFASAFAVDAWRKWVRPGMVANGETFESVSKIESGEASVQSTLINKQVRAFFMRQAALAEEMGTKPTWRTARGL